jgi:O-antigen/teichoic acid export membrane protein
MTPRRLGMSRLARNIAYNLAGQAALTVLGLVAVRFVFRGLGGEAFGIILFATAAGTLIAGVMDLGLSATIVREVSAAGEGTEVRKDAISLFRTAVSFAWAGWIALTVVLFLVAPAIATHWINVRAIAPDTAAHLLQVTCAGAFLSLPRAMYAALFRGLQKMAGLNVIEVGWLALQQAGMVGILLAGGGLFAVGWWFALSYAVGLAAFAVFTARVLSPVAVLPGFSRVAVQRNLGFALQMMSSSAFGAVLGQADRLLVSKLMPVRALGYYGFAASVAAALGRVAYAVVLAAFPSFSEAYRQSGRATMRDQHRHVQTLVLVVSAPGFAALAFTARPVFSWVFGTEIGAALTWPSIILSAGWYLNAAVSASYFVSLAVGRADISARQNFLALFLVLPAGAAVTWRFGLSGAAAIWLGYHLFALAYGIPRICRECLEEPVRAWFGQLAQMLALIGATYGLAFLAAAGLGGSSVGWLVSAFVLATAAYGVGVMRLHSSALRALVLPAAVGLMKDRAA